MQGMEAIETPSAAELRLQRNLKLLVIILGVLLFAGLAAAVGRMIYLASAQRAQPAAAIDALHPELSMQLPAGAEVKSISVSGDRLAVHYVAAAGEGIAVLDLRTGKAAASVAIERGAPGK